MKITDFVKTGNMAEFTRYRANILYFEAINQETSEMYEFPVYCEDLGGATVNKHEKCLTLMRYLRKALEDKTLVKV